ncbi:MAG TPA: hypothetical protein VMY39_04075 [Planctomycetota bacterium]|nr:hypothetical protein [Planctomycetota bacterium]
MSQGTKIKTFEGNAVRHTFLLKQFGQNAPINVSTATSIDFEYENSNGVEQTPINVSIGEPGADWASGVVVVLIAAPLTSAVGDYPFSLTVVINGETITYEVGEVNVLDRRGYPAP